MRKHDEAMISLGAQNPTWVLVCKRRFTMDGVLYNVGCLVDVTAFAKARSWSHLLQNRYVAFVPPSDVKRPSPTPLPPPATAPPAKRPAVVIVADADPIVSLGKTYAAVTKSVGGDHGLARDMIEGDRDGGRLFTAAARIFAVRKNESFRRDVSGLWQAALMLAEAA